VVEPLTAGVVGFVLGGVVGLVVGLALGVLFGGVELFDAFDVVEVVD